MALQHRAVRLLRELQSLELAVHVNLAQRTVSVATMLLGLHEPSLGVCRRLFRDVCLQGFRCVIVDGAQGHCVVRGSTV